MQRKLITAILLFLCGLGIGWLAYENIMWAVWGKQNYWFEYVGFWGCPIMFISGLVALKNLRVGTIVGCVGFLLMLFYLGPALLNLILALVVDRFTLTGAGFIKLGLIICIPLVTFVRLIWNLKSEFLGRTGFEVAI